MVVQQSRRRPLRLTRRDCRRGDAASALRAGQSRGACCLDADRDPAVIAGSVLFVTFFFVLANLLVDLSYALVDPRVRLGH